MSLDAKGIGSFVWKIIRFSACCTCKFVRKYPLVSGIVIFVLFVYICFPSFFYILLYASPILVCTAIFIRFYWKTNHPKSQVVTKKDSDDKPCPAVNKSNGPSLRHQKSVRRNARMEVLAFDRDDSPELLFSRGIYDIPSGKSSLLGEDSGLVSDVKGSSNVEHGENSSQMKTGNDQAVHEPNSIPGDGPGKVGFKSLQERENTKDGEVKEDRNKTVEWTKDDEKNLMDLGLTEMERNKRLESLIAKRRNKMAIEKSLMDKRIVPNTQIAPVLLFKHNILGGSSNPDEEVLPMPGSAPSVLLPTRNPFDLPYDPFEEKPNLTADSFQQEFMPVNQKETLFCRHESFRHGPLFTFQTYQDRNYNPFLPYYSAEKMLVDDPSVDEIKRAPDDEGVHHQHNDSLGFGSEIDLIGVEEFHNEATNSSEEKTEDIRGSGSEVTQIDSMKIDESCYSPSSSSDASPFGLDQTSKPPSSQVRKAFNLMIPPKGKTVSKNPNDYSPSPRRVEFNMFYNSYKRHGHHTRDCSVASDLQVEVSEVGSPTLLTDGTISPVEGDSVTYDGDVDRDVNSDCEELWGGSFNLSKDTNREKLRELDGIIEEDSVVVKLSGLNKRSEEPIALISPPEQEAKQIPDTTTKKSTNGSIVHNMNELVLEDTHGKEDSSIEFCKDESKTSTSSKDAKELPKPSGESNPDSVEPIGGSEVDHICNLNDSSTDKVTKNGSSTQVFDGEGEPQMLSREMVVMEPSKTSGATSAGSVKDTEHESKRSTEAEANSELSTSEGVSKSLENTKNGGDLQTLSDQERV